MLELKTKKELASEASTLAQSFGLVYYKNVTYIPVDATTSEPLPTGQPDQTIWLPLTRDEKRRLAAKQFNTMFANDAELSSFEFMVSQSSTFVERTVNKLLVKTPEGLRVLNENGDLVIPTGSFVPNTIQPLLNTDPADKQEVFDVIANWLDSDEEATSLLHHLATVLAPGWSAVKYVLLLGEGRNGKGVLLNMLSKLFGKENMSEVPRQEIANRSPMVLDLSGKLLNVVFDGAAEYLKDSGTEKSLIAGESVYIKKLYESSPVRVQTNALFIEALNREPKSNDKSAALQKRLVRFRFPNVYDVDKTFEKHMWSERMLGAFLAVLIDHYVKEDEIAEKLKLTSGATELQLEHMYVNSLALQFIKYIIDNEKDGENYFIDLPLDDASERFKSWRVLQNDISTWNVPDINVLLMPHFVTERISKRFDAATVRKVRVIKDFKQEALTFIQTLKEVSYGEHAGESVVDD